MFRFFNPVEELPRKEEEKVKNQKFNRNIYIPGIIQKGLCCNMSLIIPSGSSEDDLSATVFNSRDKVYNDYVNF